MRGIEKAVLTGVPLQITRLHNSFCSARKRWTPVSTRPSFSNGRAVRQAYSSLSREINAAEATERRGKRRIQAINPELCDDILARLAPSLERHANCDIIDLKPGVGLWSSKVHEVVKPRRHILVEETKGYMDFLQPLLSQPESRYHHVTYPTSHVDAINKVVTDGLLPEQEAYPEGDARRDQPNDSLLILASLGRVSMRVVEYQIPVGVSKWGFLWAIQNASLIRQYGQIRMLVWVNDDEKRMILPRCVADRGRRTVQAEAWLGEVYEIAGVPGTKAKMQREHNLNVLSTIQVVKGMQARGVVTPTWRKSEMQQEAESAIAKGEERQWTSSSFSVTRFWESELEELQQAFARGEFTRFQNEPRPDPSVPQVRKTRKTGAFSKTDGREAAERERLGPQTPKFSRMYYLENYLTLQNKRLDKIAAMVSAVENMDPTDPESRATVQTMLEQVPHHIRTKTELYLDDRKAVRDDPPLLQWDRRKDEPLVVEAREFFPSTPLALLDLHPRPLDGLASLLQSTNDDDKNNKKNNRDSDKDTDPEGRELFDFLLKHFFNSSRKNVKQALQLLGDDAPDALIPLCPSLTDPARGGYSNPDLMRVRMVRCAMIVEILQAWRKWQWRPNRRELWDKWAVLERGVLLEDHR